MEMSGVLQGKRVIMTFKEFKVQYALGTLSFEIIGDLTKSKRTLKKVLTILSTDKDWTVRYWVALNPNTPKDVLKELSTDEDCVVRSSVARNFTTPIEVLKELSKDEHFYVRCRLFENPNSKGLK